MIGTHADLHMHSTASDGTDAPETLPALARSVGLDVIALTDHDTTAGHAACAAAAHSVGLDFIPGIELSADPGRSRSTLHILGYWVAAGSPKLEKLTEALRRSRDERNPKIVDRLRELGVDIALGDVEAKAAGGVIGRPHIASVLVDRGYAKTMQDAFARYLGEGAEAYIPKKRADPAEAIDAIHGAGGLAVLAHPVQLRPDHDRDLQERVARLAQQGLDGIEVWHPDHTPADVQRFAALADRIGLIRTGGSDYHGPGRVHKLGGCGLDREGFEQVRASAGR